LTQKTSKDLIVVENLGKLVLFVTRLFIQFEKHSNTHDPFMTTYDRKNDIKSPLVTIKDTLDGLVQNVTQFTPEKLGVTAATVDQRKILIVRQLLNVLESAIAYCAWTCTPDNDFISQMTKICEHYQSTLEDYKKLEGKKGKKSAKENVLDYTKFFVWDFWSLERLLKLYFDDNNADAINWAAQEELATMRQNVVFKRILIEATNERMTQLLQVQDYFQEMHSKRQYEGVCQTTKVIYEKCLKR
jgi:hypothetical protein